MRETSDLRIASIKAVTPPTEICEEIPITGVAAETTWLARQAIGNVLNGTDNRLMVVAGPCSIHDVSAAREYAGRLKELVEKYRDDLLIGDAGVLREAQDHRGLEGADQRSRPGQQFSHQ